MSVFCPNCGKPNTNEATNCVACGSELKKASAGGKKFKGTMMMATPPVAGKPAGAAPTGSATPVAPAAPPAASAPTAPSQPMPPPGSAPAEPAGGGRNLAFQKTMLGPMVAPPAGGAPPSSTAPSPSSPPPAASFGTAPTGGPPPPRGGFGTAPTMTSPTNPGGSFGQPTSPSAVANLPTSAAASPAAPQAFGAQPAAFGQAPAAFGQGPHTFGQQGQGGGQPAPFGAPPAASGGGGFGAPPSGGGFPGGGASGSYNAAPTGLSDKKKKLLIAGAGCLGLIILFCVGSCLWLWKTGGELSERIENAPGGEGPGTQDQLIDKLARIPAVYMLSTITGSCRTDPTGESNKVFFTPQAFEAAKATLCKTAPTALDIVGDAARSRSENLSGTGNEALATEAGFDAKNCFLFSGDGLRIVTCRDNSDTTKFVVYQAGADAEPADPTGEVNADDLKPE